MPIPDDKTTLNFVLDKDLKSKLQVLADADKRKLGNYVAQVLEQHIVSFEMELLETFGYSGFFDAHESVFGKLKIHLFNSDLDPEMKEKLRDLKNEYDEDAAVNLDNLTPELRQFLFRNKIK